VTSLTLDAEHATAKWNRQTEYIIAITGFVFSLMTLILHLMGSATASEGSSNGIAKELASLVFFLSYCGRLAYVHYFTPPRIFGWLSAFADIIILTTILYVLSFQYGTSAASLRAPAYASYFVLIALHAVRFDARLVVSAGVLSAMCWTIMVLLFANLGAPITSQYATYLTTSDLWISGEIARISSLITFSIVLGLAVRRASKLLGAAAEKEVAEIKMREAEKTAQLKTEFLANMSHEIRTPMNGVLGMAQVLKESDLRPDQMEFINTIQTSGDALLTIINDILDFSKIEAGELRLDLAEFNLRKACEDVATLLGVAAREKGLELIINIDPDTPVNLIGDAGRLRQIMTNLIGNALKFTESGHVLVDVTGSTADHLAQLSFSIKDTGIGIPEEKLGGIFAEFAQADGSTTRRFGGTGLGLSISQSLVQLMGGEIKVESTVGVGSTFSFNIDIMMNRRLQTRSSRPEAIDLSRSRVLILDDLEVNRNILRAQVQQLGALPDIACDAREAVRKIIAADQAGSPYALVISDYQMPDIDGLAFVQALRKRPEFDYVQVVVLSSIDSHEAKQLFEALDIISYMTKPCRANDLEDAVYEGATRQRAKLLKNMASASQLTEDPHDEASTKAS